MLRLRTFAYCAAALAAASLLFLAPAEAREKSKRAPFTIKAADPSEQGDGTMSAVARKAKLHGALPRGPETAIAKAAADRAHAEAVRTGKIKGLGDQDARRGPLAPAVVGGHNFAGMAANPVTSGTPPDDEGAIGPTRYIQTLNSTGVRIIDRNTHATIGSGTLNQLAGNAASVNSFDPQIIWDPTTKRFYYMMDSVFSATDNRLAFGFSKSASPSNVTTNWCHYTFAYGTFFPDYPKLGDSQHFLIAGVNVFDINDFFAGSDIVAISKPPAGTSCPLFNTFNTGVKVDIRDTGGFRVFTPVASNQIDNNATGFVVATNGGLPSTKLWFFNVRKAASGLPVFGPARGLTVPSYDFPPNATQSNGRLLDTLDSRNTQAVQAINPARGANVHSFWTQHTVADPNGFSASRWYEINPAPAVPVVLRTGKIIANNTFVFNGAISPDRKKDGANVAFGDSFVIQYNTASPALSPRISVRSSLHGAAISGPVLIKGGVGPYVDFSCPNVVGEVHAGGATTRQ